MWTKRMFDYGFVENTDFQRINKIVSVQNGGTKTVFEYVTIGGKDYKQKRIVLTKKGLDALIKKL